MRPEDLERPDDLDVLGVGDCVLRGCVLRGVGRVWGWDGEGGGFSPVDLGVEQLRELESWAKSAADHIDAEASEIAQYLCALGVTPK